MVGKFLKGVIGFLVLAAVGSAFAKDVYYYAKIDELNITKGELPARDEEAEKRMGGWWRRWEHMSYMYPYAAGNGGEEMYVTSEVSGRSVVWNRSFASGNMDWHLAARGKAEQPASGRLFLPKSDLSGMVRIDFTIANAASDQKDARDKFLRAKQEHYERLLDIGVPGAAWYRHQVSEARSEREPNLVGSKEERRRDMMRFGRSPRGSELERSYSLFSGGRAISENLHLDRELQVLNPSKQTIDVNSIEGISIAEIPWKEIISGLAPKKDVPAGFIPADQHVIFFPSFKAMVSLTDEAKTRGTPLLRILDPRSEDAQTQERYERQLCLSMDELSRILGPVLISSVAFTGSDPYLRTGSDVAVLFEAVSAEPLHTIIVGRHAAAVSSFAGAKAVSGKIQDVEYSGVVSPGREVCSYTATLGKVVIVTNSLYQLERIVKVAKMQVASIASSDEYTFFRDRYKLGDPEETALLVLTDAAIRRWCGPRWRIGCSRRTRVAGAMAELQCRYLDELAAGKVKDDAAVKQSIAGGGEICLSPSGVRSSVYGTLEFLTPIAEIPLDKVTVEEKSSYENFSRNYQRGWRQFFDPIAVRLTIERGRLCADATIRPLILFSDYREFMEITGNAEITAEAGDRHEEALLHFIMSVDPNSQEVRQMGNFAMTMAPGIGSDALGWIGKWFSFYADEDPFWADLEKATTEGGIMGMSRFMEKNFMRLPVALHFDVSNPLKLTVFLVSARAFIEQSSPGMTVWETLKYNEQPYVKVSVAPGRNAELGEDFKDAALYYAPTGKALVATLREELLKRSLDRMAKPAVEGKEAVSGGETWLGKSMAVKAKRGALAIVQGLMQENMKSIMEIRAWGNIPILNEWKQRYPKMSPMEFHSRFWQTKLVCPGGGEYVWNDEYQTMESTVYGHPGQPRANQKVPSLLFDLTGIDLGLTFEGDGLRARTELRRGVEKDSR